jgi:alpha-glucuronidase
MSKLRLVSFLITAAALYGETGASAWLRYAPIEGAALTQYRQAVQPVVVVLNQSAIAGSARDEIVRGIRGMLDRIPRVEAAIPQESAIVLGTLAEINAAEPQWKMQKPGLIADGYWLKTVVSGRNRYTVVAAIDDRGILYGTFALLRKVAIGDPVAQLDEVSNPAAPVRWVDHWDNLTGAIERGYGGRSIFWDNGKVRDDLSRVNDYGRLLASLGIDGCSIDNVNADPRIMSPELAPQIARIADAFRPWGVRVAVSVDFSSPQKIGGLSTFDPLDPQVIQFWKTRIDDLYKAVPDLAGVVMKADSEGRLGPSAYGRTHADAANVVARALKPHGGLIFYRGFVYDNHMDWRNLKNDRGRAAWDNFHDLDGKFDDNAVIQIKNGPIDFQVREAPSPLLGTLEKTNEAIELQITQEYFGQSKHDVFLVPYWKDTLDFDMHAKGPGTPVKALVSGKVFHQPNSGFVGVSNVGMDDNWFGNQLSQGNLYGFGRLAWNPDLTSKQIADEWTKLTFGTNPKVVDAISNLQLSTWRTYENYTGPLGLQNLTEIAGNHYSVNVENSERNGWGQWHRADENGVGMDRSVATGTGFSGQYRPDVAKVFENPATTPDDLLLFLHHVPYTYKLHDGKTVIQYIYDCHYRGADEVADYVQTWKSLRGLIDEQRYNQVLAQLEYQAGQAIVWRDAVTVWFQAASHIPDAKGRVGHWPNRTEAESMSLSGYTVQDFGKPGIDPNGTANAAPAGRGAAPADMPPQAQAGLPPGARGRGMGGRGAGGARAPAEDFSGGKIVTCPAAAAPCSATMKYDGAAGFYGLNVEYFDLPNGVSHYRVFVGKQLVDEWAADLRLPSQRIDSGSSTRRVIEGVALRPGDEIRIEGKPDGQEAAALDYVEILPAKN